MFMYGNAGTLSMVRPKRAQRDTYEVLAIVVTGPSTVISIFQKMVNLH